MSMITKSLQVLGSYRMMNLMGFNGMFATFQVVESSSQAPGALVVVHKSNITKSGAWEAAQRDVAAVAGSSIPHVCPAGGAGEEAAHYFAIYAWMQGRHLGLQIQDHGLPTPAESFGIAAQVAEGLGGLHRKGVSHRVLSPASIFIDEAGHVQLLHAGWGRLILGARDGLLNPAWGCITPFVAPEVAEGRDPDEASDVYALGANLFFLLRGQPPYWHDDPKELLQAIRNGKLDFSSVPGSLPPHAREVLEEMLARNPDDRPVNLPALSDRLKSVARKLDALTQDEPIKGQEPAPSGPPTNASGVARKPDLPKPMAVPETPKKRALPSEEQIAAITVPDPEATPKGRSKQALILMVAGTVLLAGAGIVGLSILMGVFGDSEEAAPAPAPTPKVTVTAVAPAEAPAEALRDYDKTTGILRAAAQLAIGFHRNNGEWPTTTDQLKDLGATDEELLDAWQSPIEIRQSFVISAGQNKKWDDADDIWWDAEKNLRGGFHPASKQ